MSLCGGHGDGRWGSRNAFSPRGTDSKPQRRWRRASETNLQMDVTDTQPGGEREIRRAKRPWACQRAAQALDVALSDGREEAKVVRLEPKEVRPANDEMVPPRDGRGVSAHYCHCAVLQRLISFRVCACSAASGACSPTTLTLALTFTTPRLRPLARLFSFPSISLPSLRRKCSCALSVQSVPRAA